MKAHLWIGNNEFKGDIEIHLSENSWYTHEHHKDKKYNNVILHISFWKTKKERPLLTEEGRPLLCCSLEEHLTVSESRILQLIDLDLYPHKKFFGNGKCAEEVFSRLNKQQVEDFFRSAANWRLMQKRKFMAHRAPQHHLELGLGISRCLGYKHNADIFERLFLLGISQKELGQNNELCLLSIMLGVSGFFKDRYQYKWGASPFYQKLHALFQEEGEREGNFAIVMQQIRPSSHPVRRMVYLSKLLADPSFPNLYESMIDAWKQSWDRQKKKNFWGQFLKTLYSLIPCYKDEYWNSHYTFEPTARKESIVLIGNDLKKTILVNAFFPLLHHNLLKNGSRDELEAFNSLYSTLSASQNGKMQYLTHRFFGNSNHGMLFNKLEIGQGALQLHHDFCMRFETSCQGCPFIAAYDRCSKE